MGKKEGREMGRDRGREGNGEEGRRGDQKGLVKKTEMGERRERGCENG